jgi:GTP-binding protein Era
MLKMIGQQARRDIEGLLGSRVYLGLWVKVRRDWRKDKEALRRFGFLQRHG